jgi:hypothetical protein
LTLSFGPRPYEGKNPIQKATKKDENQENQSNFRSKQINVGASNYKQGHSVQLPVIF